MTINAWQKAEKLERINFSTKESMIDRFKNKGRYWDYVEAKSYAHSDVWTKYRDRFEACIHKFIGKPFSSFRSFVTKSKEYQSNKLMRYYYNDWFIDIGSYSSNISSKYYWNYYTNAQGIIQKHKEEQTYRRFKWTLQDHDLSKDQIFEIDGIPFLRKNGIHFMQSSQHPVYITYTEEAHFCIYTMKRTIQQVPEKNYTWVQMNKKQLRDFKLTNL